jgi:hypothetical protein
MTKQEDLEELQTKLASKDEVIKDVKSTMQLLNE